MNQDNQHYCHEGARCVEQMFQINEKVALRVLCYTPAYPVGNIPIVIVTGLVTIVDSFRNIIYDLTKDFPVYFIETRDRTTSEIRGRARFDIETMGLDTASIIRQLGFEDRKYILMGYSFGGSIISDCYLSLESRPKYILFMEPTPAFHYPGWSLIIIRLFGVPLYKLLKPIGKWYMGKFFINKKEDNEMAVISSQSLDNADPAKLRNTILAISGYSVWEKLHNIDCPALIVGTSKDHLHVPEEITRMATEIKNCTYIDLETNLRTHSIEMAQLIRQYVSGSLKGLKLP
jgi:pimeloyl-ACP methyl ester carboxylesterase